ncbi:DUF6281 family protein [Streptomyces sp. YKOK-I1]
MRWTGWPVLVAATVVAAVACAGSGGGEAEASCAYRIRYEGRTYGDVAHARFTIGRELGPATLPACDDTGGADGTPPAEEVTAYQVAGVSPELAVAVGNTPQETRLVAVRPAGELPAEVRELITAD